MRKDISFLRSNLIAHRGIHNSYCIENTIGAFIKAINRNYIIELDIHILQDNEIVVFHDFLLTRLTGVKKMIEKMSYAQLSKLKIKNKYQIPTLKQVMHIVNGKVPILIEVKDIYNNTKFYKELVKILDNYEGKFAIQSSNPKVIEWFKKNKKDYVIGLIIFNRLNYKLFRKYTRKIDFLTVYKKELPFKDKKLIIGWTIKNEKEFLKYVNISDNLICENILK